MIIVMLLGLSVVWLGTTSLIFHWFFSTALWERITKEVPDSLKLVFGLFSVSSLITTVGSYFVSDIEFTANVYTWGGIFGIWAAATALYWGTTKLLTVRQHIRSTKGLK